MHTYLHVEFYFEDFQQVLAGLDAEIKNASFLAIDTEFTGLHDCSATSKICALDTPEERYRKIRSSSSKFLVVQFGLSIFQYKSGKYYCKSYNFYTFPSNNFSLPGHPDASFLCQTSSISFLASHGFDFNKLFQEGRSFSDK